MEGSASIAAIEYRVLRQEMLLRIACQNFVILATTLMFFTASAVAVALPSHALLLCLAYVIASGAGALQWCHHGIRTKQISDYLKLREASLGAEDTWSQWLPANRPQTLLGSRWMISTKGVFVGTQVSLLAGSVWWTPEPPIALFIIGLLGAVITAAFLFTNPKE